MGKAPIDTIDREQEKAFLVGIARPDDDRLLSIEDSLSELKELARTAGVACVGETAQRLREINSARLVGKGKLEEIKARAEELGARIVLFDEELSPGQQKNLEEYFGEEIKVLDRTALILDIFASHARSREGQLQVELAQYQYRLPRLTGMWTHLARQAGGRVGGVGLRGPGETQLELDRRTIRRKIASLKKKLEHVRQGREKLREKRRQDGLLIAALAGYTNAGKSTLLNALCDETLLVEDKLFSTLDPTTRRVRLPGGMTVLITDTVGFISKLPHDLVAAFRATFEEITEADLILHVVDASHPHASTLCDIVEKELTRIAAADIPVLRVWNKIDRLTEEERARFLDGTDGAAISALSREELPALRERMEDVLQECLVPMTVRLPYSEGKALNLIRETGTVLSLSHEDDATLVTALVPRALKKQLKDFQPSS